MTVDRLVVSSSSRIDLNFFGDVSLSALRDEHTGFAPAGFAVGPLGFQVTGHLSDHLVGRTEYVLAFEDGHTVADVERVYLEYRSEHWALAAGRTHAELGYWNNAFHHGRWLQLTINRPYVLRFEDEGGFLPVHQVGANLAYGPKRGDGGVEFAVGVANGHGPVLEEIQTNFDNNWSKSVLVRIGAVGIGSPSLRFGVNFGVDGIEPADATVRPFLADTRIVEIITGAYIASRSDPIQLFAEVYNVLHRGGDRAWGTTDGFVTFGYRVGAFIPFGQLEIRHGDGLGDPFYRPNPALESETVSPTNFVSGIAGMRYEINPWSALKLELEAHKVQTADSSYRNDYRAELNWSFGR